MSFYKPLASLLAHALAGAVHSANTIGANLANDRRTFFKGFHLEHQRRGIVRQLYGFLPMEIRRLGVERGCGSVRRIDPALRATFKPTRRR